MTLSAVPAFEPHAGYGVMARAAAQAGVSPADPLVQPLAEARRQAEAYHRFIGGGAVPLARVTGTTVAGPRGLFRLRLYHPTGAGALPVVLYCHGGGYVINSLDTHDSMLRLLARESQVAVCSLGYSKAPEARFPVQLEEALQAVDWLTRHGAEHGIDASRLVLAGDSAGAHLALTTARVLTGRCRQAVKGLVLAYGMYEPAETSSSHQAYGEGYNLTSRRMRWFWDQFLVDPADREDPLAAPLTGNLSGLPPSLLLSAEFDCLRDDSFALASALEAASSSAELIHYPDLQHSFLTAHAWLPPARQALGVIARTARAWLADG